MTTNFWYFALSLAAAVVRMVSMDSSFASRIKLQVLIITTSASSRSEGIHPFSFKSPSMTSLSTRFLGQPRLIMRTVFGEWLMRGYFAVGPAVDAPGMLNTSTPRGGEKVKRESGR